MAKIKAKTKAKEPVKIRFKKLANGNQSIYLDYYSAGKREYEILRLYLIPENTPADKEQNKVTLQLANAIKSQRILDIARGAAGIKSSKNSKMLLADWLQIVYEKKEKKGKSTGALSQIRNIKKLTALYKGEKTTMAEIDKAYCIGFIDYLKHHYITIKGRPLNQVTAHNYLGCFTSVLNEAVRAEVIDKNPMLLLSPEDKIKAPESQRVFLSTKELEAIIETAHLKQQVQRAFLFSCFCGLRISDIRRLRWGDITINDGQAMACIIQKKTKQPLYAPLSAKALEYLPERGAATDNDFVFKISTPSSVNTQIKRWALRAGINKNISFHTARHTFGTLLKTLGADIYTIKELMGHSSIKTTLIYSKITDGSKVKAVGLLDSYFNQSPVKVAQNNEKTHV